MYPILPEPHPGGSLITFGDKQPPYIPLPASVDSTGTVMTEWEFTAEDLEKILAGGRIRLWVMFTQVHQGKPLTPIKIEVIKSD